MTESSSQERIQRLLSPERLERLDVHRILSLLPLRPYLRVADIGCGPGLFTIPLAKSLWDGKVYAVDIDEEMLEAVRRRSKEARLGNVVALKSEEGALVLEPESLDGVLLICVLHEVADKASFLESAVGALKQGGWCAVIEWRTGTGTDKGPPPEQRIGEADMALMAREAHLRVTLRRELNDYHYMLLLNK